MIIHPVPFMEIIGMYNDFYEKFGKLWAGMLAVEYGMRKYLAVKEGLGISFSILIHHNPDVEQHATLPSCFRKQTAFFGALAAEFTRVSGVQVDQEISVLRNIIAHGFLGGKENEDMKIVKVDGRTTPFTVERRELTTGYLDELTEKVSSLKEEIEQVLIPLIGDSSKVLTI